MSMRKAKYHVPQYREVVNFDGACCCEVALWDSKHSIITTTFGERIRVKDRSSIKVVGADSKPAEPAKKKSRTEAGDGLRWVDSSTSEPVSVAAAFTVRLPTSFASEVERAKAIADAEAEEKKRREKVIDEMNRLADEIVALTNKRRDIVAANDDAEEDHRLRVNYLRSLRVRGE